jgi:hypothetical protein
VSGNILLLLLSFLFIFIIVIYLRNEWPDLDVIDLYIIFVLLHFGFTPFIRGLYFGKDIIFDFRNSNTLALALVFGHILIILLIVRGVSRFFPPELSKCLKIRYLLEEFGRLNKYVLLTVYVCLVLFPIISYVVYGVKPYIMPEDFKRFGKNLPYWFTSIRTIYNYIVFWVFFGLLGNIVKSNKYQQYLWSIATIILVIALSISGRRFLVSLIVVWVISWLVYHKRNIFRLRYITVSLLLAGILFISSNIYQTYRSGFLFKEGKMDFNKIENPLLAALNSHSTIHNLQIRAGTWEFNYLVFNQQVNKSGITTNGVVSREIFKSSIPRFFWPGKQFSLTDDYLAEFFKLKPSDFNIAKNIFGLAQLDFGFFSIIIIPAFLLMIIGCMGIITSKTSQYPTFLLMFAANFLWYLISVEDSANEIFSMVRNILIISLLFGLYIMSKKIYTICQDHKMGN